MIRKLENDNTQLEEEVKTELVERIIPFWKALRDNEHGGYYGYVDFDLQVDPSYEKGCILNSRILWFFSEASVLLGQKELLSEADHGYEFLKNQCLDQEFGGVYWAVSGTGESADSTKHTYNQAFAIYALASYYRASGHTEALDCAMDLFDLIEEKCTDSYGYKESFSRTWIPEDNDKLSENGLLADKTMNTLLHVLEAYTELYRATKNEQVGEALKRALQLFSDVVYNAEKQQLEVFFDEKMNTISDLYSYGHDIEASWLLDRACEVLGIESLTSETNKYTEKLAEAVYKHALNEDGSMSNECFRGKVDKTRVWWVQAEAMVGFFNCYQKTGEEKYRNATEGLWKYIKEYVIDKRAGAEWFWDLDEKNTPSNKKPVAEPWKCPYHNGRMCMELMRRIGYVA